LHIALNKVDTDFAVGWAVWGSNPSDAKIFVIHPDQFWRPPSLLCNGQWVSTLGVKQLDRAFTTHLYPAPSLKKE